MSDICIIGLGYMGLPMASLLATNGFNVIGVDKNPAKVNNINDAICPFEELGMKKLMTDAVTSGNLIATTSIPRVPTYIISVPTPEKDHKCDLSFVLAACSELANVIEDGSLVIIESTIKPNTCKNDISPIFKKHNKNILISHCPERAIPGNTIYELINNDRIIGGLSQEATARTYDIYKRLIKGNIHLTDATTAECCKLMENTYRDVNIALANEFSLILEEFGVNPWSAITLANKHPRVNILSPGPGVGGHCIAVDPWFLTEDTNNAKLIKTAREINNNRPYIIVEKVVKIIANKYKKIGILGVAYKKDVDDCRESPAIQIVQELLRRGYDVKCSDPHVKNDFPFKLEDLNTVIDWCDVIVITTDHSEYTNLVLPTDKILFNACRNMENTK